MSEEKKDSKPKKAVKKTTKAVKSKAPATVSYTHLTLPTNREV